MGLRRRIATTFAASAAAAGLAVGLAAPATALSEAETNEFLGKLTATYNDPTVSSDGNPYDFDIVTKAALVTGADKILAGLDSFTLFAPNDRAFEVTANNLGLLGKNYKYSAKVDETRVFNAIASSGVDVTEILLYHVIPNAKVTGKRALRDNTVTRNFSWLAMSMRWVKGPESTCLPVTLALGITWYSRISVTSTPLLAMALKTRPSSRSCCTT